MVRAAKELATVADAIGGFKVHVIDDEILVVRVTSKMLLSMGYEVGSSTNPIEVVDLLRSDRQAFDVLVTDLDMPQQHGHELIGQLRVIRPDLPVVVVTGRMPPIGERVADRYLLKPCTSESLSIAINEAFALRL